MSNLSLSFLLSIFFLIKCNEGPLQYPEPAGGWDDGDCKSLNSQSPIDIPPNYDNSVVIDDGDKAKIISMNYSIINSGEVAFDKNHKWTTEELDIGNLIIRLNKTIYNYKVNNIHFHLYSEHRLQNKQFPMEMHIVHKNMNQSDTLNENLVIGVLFDYEKNVKSEFLENMKLAEEEEINGADIKSIINGNDPFYYYKGGLTTVPCTENVNWIVFKSVHNFSYEQFSKMKKWITSSGDNYYNTGYGNARGPKPINGRNIFFENSNVEDNNAYKEALLTLVKKFPYLMWKKEIKELLLNLNKDY